MKSFDMTERWNRLEEAVDASVEPDEDADSVPPAEVLAKGGSALLTVRSPPSGRTAALVAEGRRPAASRRWLEDIYRRYRQLVWRKLRRRDVVPESTEGMQQEVFLIMERLVQKNGVPKSVLMMLLTIAGNVICNYLRRRERGPCFDAEVEPDEVPESQPDVEQRMRSAERERIMKLILARMPTEAAMLIRRIDLGELTHAEVAAILKRPAETVKTQHRRARSQFEGLAKRLYKEDLQGGA
jgi:RNA polymerase sigma factor (sigma-70 family)